MRRPQQSRLALWKTLPRATERKDDPRGQNRFPRGYALPPADESGTLPFWESIRPAFRPSNFLSTSHQIHHLFPNRQPFRRLYWL
jgi:hypothetical protein